MLSSLSSVSSIKEFTFKISLPSSIDVMGLKYISSKYNIYPRFKFNSESFFIIESKNSLNSFFSMFFEKYPNLRVRYIDLSFSLGDLSLEEIKDTETCQDVSNRIFSHKNIVVSYIL
jgi:hypothetical protein